MYVGHKPPSPDADGSVFCQAPARDPAAKKQQEHLRSRPGFEQRLYHRPRSPSREVVVVVDLVGVALQVLAFDQPVDAGLDHLERVRR